MGVGSCEEFSIEARSDASEFQTNNHDEGSNLELLDSESFQSRYVNVTVFREGYHH